MERTLEANGYDPREIEMLHVPQAAEYDALVAGGLDAAFVGEPWYTLLQEGGGRVLAPAKELFDGYQHSVVLYGPSLLDGDQAVGERFAVALLRGLRRYDEGKPARNLDALAEVMGQGRDELVDLCWPSMGSDGFIDIPSLMEFQAWAVDRGDQDAIVPPESFWEPRFIEQANQTLEERSR